MTKQIAYVFKNHGTHEFEIHKMGCQHLSPARRHPWADIYPVDLNGRTIEEFIQCEVDEYEHQEQGWTRKDFKVFPCAKR